MIADVSGHGLSAALVTAMLKAPFRQIIRQAPQQPDSIARAINTELVALHGMEHFVTCFLGHYDPKCASLEYANCGHEPGVLLDAQGQLKTRLQGSGLPLGVCADAAWETRTVSLEPGDRLHLFTDGLAETPAPDGSLFGRDRLTELIRTTVCEPPTAQVETLLRQRAAFRDGGASLDDMTLVIYRCDMDSSAP